MRGVLTAEGAVLARLDSFRMSLLILRHVIITMLAHCALQRDSGSLATCHESIPPCFILQLQTGL